MNRTFMALMAAVVGMPLAAQAQYGTGDTRTDTTTIERTQVTDESESSWRRPSVGIMADVGVSDYSNDVNRDIDAGVGYGARVDLSPMRNFGVELGYAGAVNDLDESLSTDGRLVTNQIGGNLRVNLVPPTYDLPLGFKPFVFGGAMYHRIDSQNFTPGVTDGINAFAIPVGAGLEADIGKRFLVGGRFTYNFLFNEVDGFGGRNADNWLATVNLGARLGT
jgi:hypothetical protein